MNLKHLCIMEVELQHVGLERTPAGGAGNAVDPTNLTTS